mmetsp:Transcript_35216/g.82158  ORF Transcript_35216/g.82158 Transcript_35216/m.82158 type:complete len:528 (+) Transcript_35216:38-1621(+)
MALPVHEVVLQDVLQQANLVDSVVTRAENLARKLRREAVSSEDRVDELEHHVELLSVQHADAAESVQKLMAQIRQMKGEVALAEERAERQTRASEQVAYTMQGEIDRAKAAATEHERHIQDGKQREEELLSKLKTSEQELEEARLWGEGLAMQVSLLEKRCAESTEVATSSRTELARVKAQLRDQAKERPHPVENPHAQDEVAELRRGIDERDNELRQCHEELTALAQRAAAAEANPNLSRALERASASDKERAAWDDPHLGALLAERDELKAEVDRLAQRVIQRQHAETAASGFVDQQNEKLSMRDQAIHQLAQQLQRLDNENDSIATRLDRELQKQHDLSNENSYLQEAIAERDRHIAKLEEWRRVGRPHGVSQPPAHRSPSNMAALRGTAPRGSQTQSPPNPQQQPHAITPLVQWLGERDQGRPHVAQSWDASGRMPPARGAEVVRGQGEVAPPPQHQQQLPHQPHPQPAHPQVQQPLQTLQPVLYTAGHVGAARPPPAHGEGGVVMTSPRNSKPTAGSRLMLT